MQDTQPPVPEPTTPTTPPTPPIPPTDAQGSQPPVAPVAPQAPAPYPGQVMPPPQAPNTAPTGPKPSEPGSGLALAALVTGIFAIFSSLTFVLNVVLGVAAIVVAILSFIKKAAGKNRIISIIAIVLGVIAIIIGTFTIFRDGRAIMKSFNGGNTVQGTDITFSDQDQGFIDAKKDFTSKETASIGVFSVKVNSLKTGYDSPTANQYSKSQYDYVLLNITMKNNAKDRKQLSDYAFRLEGDGFDPMMSDNGGPEPVFGDTVVDPGQERTGNIVFKVPKGYTGSLKLTYIYKVYAESSSRSKELKYTIAL